METGLITTLLGIIIASIFSQTTAVWVKFNSLEKKMTENNGNLEKKINESKCPFGQCPLYERAKTEAVPDRRIETGVMRDKE